MDFLVVALFIIISIIVANFLSQLVPKIPKAFWQILAGIMLALVPGTLNAIHLTPDLFLMLIIAPLLFYEGQHTNASVISKNFSAIIRLAGILALVTVIVLGFTEQAVLHWVLPLAVALAAIVTPTDATALDSVTSTVEMPSGINRALNLESLFNDASGLVVLELALAWLNTGHFSFVHGFKEFLIAAFGGAIVGLILGFVIVWIRQNLLRAQLDDSTAQIMIQLLSPVAIYIIAEHFHVSGIIAVVMAGVVHNEERAHMQFMSAQLNNLSNQVWEMVSQVLNGIVFVLLGLELVRIVEKFIDTTGYGWVPLVGVGILIYIIMVAIRFISMEFSQKEDVQRFMSNGKKQLDSTVFAIGGVHGAMTMAMALSLPYTLKNGQPFPYRDNIILIASTVIIFSLVMPLLVLPRILPKAKQDYDTTDYDKAHLGMVSFAMSKVESSSASANTKKNVTRQLQSQLGYGDEQLDTKIWTEAANRINQINNKAIEEAMDADQISPDAAQFYQRISHNTGLHDIRHRFRVLWHNFERKMMHMIDRHANSDLQMRRKRERIETFIDREQKYLDKMPQAQREQMEQRIQQQRSVLEANAGDAKQTLHKMRQAQRERWADASKEIQNVTEPAVEADIQALEESGENPRLALAMRNIQVRNQNTIQQSVDANSDDEATMMNALQAELEYIQNGRENGSISPALAKALYDEVNAAQALVLAIEPEE